MSVKKFKISPKLNLTPEQIQETNTFSSSSYDLVNKVKREVAQQFKQQRIKRKLKLKVLFK